MSFVELKKWREFRKNKFEWRLILVYFVQNSSDAFSSDRLQMMVILQDWEMDVMSLSVPFGFVGRKMLSVVFNGGCDIRRLPRKKGCIGKWGLNNLLCHLNFKLIIDEARYSRFIESYFFFIRTIWLSVQTTS
ncbi:uncharacterized protein [Triticum aestivum]|uniref:uncharacterized protein isoform X1 n=1 Tax=Triticum aestivum TaxID=4565 RepID=UPI001D01388C|nr:uncharacterized protein LOC123133693 isoform X1 [Triticum aestivum]